MQNSPGPNSTAKMHKYILGLTGVMIAFGVSFPIAMIRVSATPKFAGQPLNSQTCDSKQPATRAITSWVETCSRMSVAPIAPQPAQVTSPPPLNSAMAQPDDD
jgi:hypothetical protein